jgi:hypothetical protein
MNGRDEVRADPAGPSSPSTHGVRTRVVAFGRPLDAEFSFAGRRRPGVVRMKRKLAFLAAVAGLLEAGCVQYMIYDVRLEPKPEGLERTMSAQRSGRDSGPANERPSDAEMERLASLYPERLTKGSEPRQTFRGVFADKLPADIGGSGSYRKIDTPLGSAYWYTERFRGADDLDAEIYARRAAADRLADLTIGWFDEQMKDSPHHTAVRKFLHQEFRQDLRNLVAYLWHSYHPKEPVEGSPKSPQIQQLPGPAAGIIAFLAERGYLEPGGPTAIARYYDEDRLRLDELRRLLARKSGLPEAEADAAFPFLTDQTAIGLSAAAYLRKTPEYEALRKAWKPDPNKPEVTEPDPFEVLGTLVGQMCDLTFLFGRDELTLSLVVPNKPYLTNGIYEPHDGLVTWRTELPTKREMPHVCLAHWAVPDEKAQRAVHGKIALKEDKLAMFAVLFSGLTAERQKEFAAYVEEAKRDETVRARAGGFRFAEPVDERTRDFYARAGKLLE